MNTYLDQTDQTITESFFARHCPTSGLDPGRHSLPEWRALNSLHGHLENAATKALAEFDLSLVEFTVLDILQEQVNGHMRMQDVALVAGLTTGATTRLVNRLEERGLLRRLLCDSDRRGIYTELTPEGLELLARARPRHDAAIRDILTAEATAHALANIAEAIRTR
jgi:DNA-binding MarR family transcriptional regulator